MHREFVVLLLSVAGAGLALEEAPLSASATGSSWWGADEHSVSVPINEGGSGAASGRSAPSCPGPVHLRARNASELDFDSVEIDGVQFGALRRGAESEYRLTRGCVYSYGAIKVTSGKQRFVTWPIDFVGERPLQAGYYTHALTVQPGRPGDAGNVNSRISKDPPP